MNLRKRHPRSVEGRRAARVQPLQRQAEQRQALHLNSCARKGGLDFNLLLDRITFVHDHDIEDAHRILRLNARKKLLSTIVFRFFVVCVLVMQALFSKGKSEVMDQPRHLLQ